MQVLFKYGSRIFVACLIYFYFHITLADEISQAFLFNYADRIFFVYITLVVLLIWELLDLLFKHPLIASFDLKKSKDLIKSVLLLSVIVFPLVVLFSYISEYVLKPSLEECLYPEDHFIKDILNGQLFAWLIIAEKLIRKYYIESRKYERDKALMQKELLLSQYVSLKNQIKPHFLFNSFSVLQSLIETNPEKASTFLTRLSKMYRYILESREDSMSSLQRELEILDAYLFLLNVRHEGSILVDIDIDPKHNSSFLPTMSLQMLMENVVKHNHFNASNPLKISIYIDGEYLVIKNNLNKKGESVISTKIGLENINSQYHLQSDKSMVVVEDEASFTVKLPVLSKLRLT